MMRLAVLFLLTWLLSTSRAPGQGPVAHAFTVIGVDIDNRQVTLQNPWHTSGRYGYQFEITFGQLVSWIDQLSIEA